MPLSSIAAEKTSAENKTRGEDGAGRQRLVIVAVSIGLLAGVALIVWTAYVLLRPETPAESVQRLRDIFIIVVALESLVIGIALTVLVIQLASLINLLRNEVRPILRATNETVNTLRGTTEFLGENVVQPVIEIRGYLAGITRVLELMRIKKK